MKNLYFKRKTGITLVALTITIVILLILLAVTINLFFSNNGILVNSGNAAIRTEEEKAREFVGILLHEYLIEKMVDNKILGDFLEEKLEEKLIDNLFSNGDGSFIVEKDGYEIFINADGQLEENSEVAVNNIILNPASVTLSIGKSSQLSATVEPEKAWDKTLIWSSSNPNVVTVSEGGLVTAKAIGSVAITATANDGSGVKATCNVTVLDTFDFEWYKLHKIAEAISNTPSITKTSSQATVKVDGTQYTLNVGDKFNVKYAGVEKEVRIIGFNHDDLKNKEAYGTPTATGKAGITFDFKAFMTGDVAYRINSTTSNSGGWAESEIRRTLNGYSSISDVQSATTVGGLGASLSNKSYIKQVKKEYIPAYDNASKRISEDYLWLLSCGEIWSTGWNSANAGLAIAKEGTQYNWYNTYEKGISYDKLNMSFAKIRNTATDYRMWWLRSPSHYNKSTFCTVGTNGSCNTTLATDYYYVSPGFCI